MNEQDQNDTPAITLASRGCVELWAGSELAHRHVQLVGLEADVLSLPCAAQEGGDLYAFFSCAADREARILLADCVGHGHEASVIASYIHGLIRRHRDILDNSRFLSALNDEFARPGQTPEAPLRLSTFITATFDRHTGEFNYAYAAHPRMFLWQARYRRWFTLDGLEGFPVGAFAGSAYTQQSIHVEPADIILMFSDGATDVLSPDDEMLTVEGLLELASRTLEKLPVKFPLALFVSALAEAIRDFHGSGDLEDDLTLLTLRRSSLVSASL